MWCIWLIDNIYVNELQNWKCANQKKNTRKKDHSPNLRMTLQNRNDEE